MKKETIALIVGLIALIVLLVNPFNFEFIGAVYPNVEYNQYIWRPVFPAYYDFDLVASKNINLVNGVHLENIQSIDIVVKACDGTAKFSLLGTEKTIPLPSCKEITFKDNSGQEYIDFKEQKVTLYPLEFKDVISKSFSVDVSGIESSNVNEMKLTVTELVQCTRDSQCPTEISISGKMYNMQCLQNKDSLDYHYCGITSLGEAENTIDELVAQDKIDETSDLTTEEKRPSALWYVIPAVVIAGLGLFAFAYLKRRRTGNWRFWSR